MQEFIDLFVGQPWQDLVFTFGGFVFAASLLPTVLDSSSQVPRSTSVPTALTLTLFTVAFASMGFWLSMSANLMTASMWYIVATARAPPEGDE